MNIDEADPYTADLSDKEAGNVYKSIAFRLDKGIDPNPSQRSIILISTNRPLSDLVGVHSESACAATNRIFTIPIDPQNKWGVFNRKRKNPRNVAEYVAALSTASREHYGAAGQKYLEQLVYDRKTDAATLAARISKSMAEFRSAVNMGHNDGDTTRKVDAFGLVYAAGQLARSYKIVPGSWDCLEAVLACYEMYASNKNAPVPFALRLMRISGMPKVVDLASKPSAAVVQRGQLFLGQTGQQRELFIRPTYILNVFPNWKELSKMRSVNALRVRDKDNPNPKRTLPGAKASRFVVLRLP